MKRILIFLAAYFIFCSLILIVNPYIFVTDPLGFLLSLFLTGLMLVSCLWDKKDNVHNLRSLLSNVFCRARWYLSFLFILLCSYCAFALIGNRAILEPNASFTLTNVLWFLFTILWFIPTNLILLNLVQKLSVSLFLTERSIVKKCYFWLPFIFSVIVWTGYLIVFWPGIMSTDSFDQWDCVITNNYSNWHPVFHTLFIKLAYLVYPSPATYVVFQIIFGAWVFARFTSFLTGFILPEKRWISYIFAIILSLLPTNIYYMVTIWKDIPYTISLAWLTMILLKLITGYNNKKSLAFELCVSLVFVALLRHNGTITFYLTSILLIFYLISQKYTGRAIYCAIICSFICIILFKNIVLPELAQDYQTAPAGNTTVGMTCTLINDYVAVDRLGGIVPKFILTDIENSFVDKENLVFNYYNCEPWYYWARSFDENSYLSLINASKLSYDTFKPYIEMALASPTEFLQAILLRTESVWGISESQNSRGFGLVNYMGREEEQYLMYDLHRTNFYRLPFIPTFEFCTSGILHLFIWRIGIWNVFLLLMIFLLLLNRQPFRTYLLIVPFISNMIFLFFSAYSDFRFVYPQWILAIFLIPSLMACLRIIGKDQVVNSKIRIVN